MVLSYHIITLNRTQPSHSILKQTRVQLGAIYKTLRYKHFRDTAEAPALSHYSFVDHPQRTLTLSLYTSLREIGDMER